MVRCRLSAAPPAHPWWWGHPRACGEPCRPFPGCAEIHVGRAVREPATDEGASSPAKVAAVAAACTRGLPERHRCTLLHETAYTSGSSVLGKSGDRVGGRIELKAESFRADERKHDEHAATRAPHSGRHRPDAVHHAAPEQAGKAHSKVLTAGSRRAALPIWPRRVPGALLRHETRRGLFFAIPQPDNFLAVTRQRPRDRQESQDFAPVFAWRGTCQIAAHDPHGYVAEELPVWSTVPRWNPASCRRFGIAWRFGAASCTPMRRRCDSIAIGFISIARNVTSSRQAGISMARHRTCRIPARPTDYERYAQLAASAALQSRIETGDSGVLDDHRYVGRGFSPPGGPKVRPHTEVAVSYSPRFDRADIPRGWHSLTGCSRCSCSAPRRNMGVCRSIGRRSMQGLNIRSCPVCKGCLRRFDTGPYRPLSLVAAGIL